MRGLVARHVAETNSRYADMLSHEWDRALPQFWQVVSKEYMKYLSAPLSEEPAVAMRA